jgi:hypothetical protein
MRRLRWFHIGAFILLAVIAGGFLATSIWPSLGAQGADVLRSILGVRAVAQMETVLFEVQDAVRGLEYRSGLKPASVPWQESTVPVLAATPQPLPSRTLTHTVSPTLAVTPTLTGEAGREAVGAPSSTPTVPLPSPTSLPTTVEWLPAQIQSPGNLPDAGVWQPYLSDPNGEVIGYRAFIQPDRQRPYVVAAVVAFNLNRIKLHYVLGTDEPFSPDKAKRPGDIPTSDRIPGVLVAAFNGGFKAIHGYYGAMSDGLVAIQPREGLGTVAIYKDGRVRIGEWGRDIVYDPSMVSYRQNCPLLLQDGAINPLVDKGSISDWGGNLDGTVVTFRSAIGISQDDQTLYYLAGPHLSMPVLAKALVAIGSYQAIQLDINNYYVHFTAIRADGENLIADPLMPEFMTDHVDRYLKAFFRDFFYVTVRDAPLP